MNYSYKPTGVCSQQIDFSIEDGVVKNVKFFGGCPGNLQGIGRLVEGRSAADVAEILKGVRCGGKPTSCPDQLSRALAQALAASKN